MNSPTLGPILGLHHVTATVDDAQADLDFYVGTLGLRLVKKTVNFDNRHVYHFYYGNERGAPGSIWTTFPYRGRGVRVGKKGTGQVVATAFSVPVGSLEFWKGVFRRNGAVVQDGTPRYGEPSIAVRDPSGLMIELIATGQDQRPAWTGGGVGEAVAVRGLHSVSLSIQSPARTVELMTGLLGFQMVAESGERMRLSVGGEGPGHRVDIVHEPGVAQGVNGLGTVHHVALAIAHPDDQARLRFELLGLGYTVTEVLDRQYFKSIYFREPGGVLFEVATVSPGFEVDEPFATLGDDLKLPPWEEPRRSEIEAGLPAIVRPG